MSKLKIAEDLSLPIDVVTQKLGWIGTTGSGKTYGASKLAELLWDAHAHFIVLDPVGVWYGLRLAKDGKKPSDITIPIFGGLHGDVPLEATAGAMMADLLVDRALTAILDVSQFESDAQKARFAADFGDRFFFRKKASPSAVHLFIEECQEFVPENHQRGEERMKHVFVRMQKIGRNFGIGTSYITQRPQEVSKKALNLAQTLFVFRTTGTHEREAINRWIKDKSIEGQDIASELPKLKTGAPHVWSPEWLNLSSVAHILEKRTFNASATPEVGATARSRELAPIDLEKIRTEMAATIDKAKADDPKELRKRIHELERFLQTSKALSQSAATPPAKETRVEVLTDSDRVLLEKLAERLLDLKRVTEIGQQAALTDAIVSLSKMLTNFEQDLTEREAATHKAFAALLDSKGFQAILGKLATVNPQPTTQKTERPFGPARVGPRTQTPIRQSAESAGNGMVRGGKFRSMLIALAQANQPLADSQLTARAGMALSGTFDKYLGQMRAEGWVSGDRNGLSITQDGLTALGHYDPLPTGDALQDYWLTKLGNGKKREMLAALISAYPRTLSDEQIAEQAQMALSGTFDKYLGQLRSLMLVEGSRSALKASQELFA